MTTPIPTVASNVTAILDGDWTIETIHPDQATATRADGLALNFHRTHRQESMSVSLKRETRPDRNENPAEINANSTRTAASLAADITRRLMPAAEEGHTRDLERLAGVERYQRAEQVSREALAVAGATPYGDDGFTLTFTPFHGYAKLRVHGGTVDAEIHGLTADEARTLVNLLKTFTRAE